MAAALKIASNPEIDFSQYSPQQLLTTIYGHQGFKPQQQDIITRVLNREGHTLGIMPTGGGKSLCFQIPALLQENLTVVISPLIALMKDQIDALTKKEINVARFVNSSLSEQDKEEILHLVMQKKIKLLYLSPEGLKSERILEVLNQTKIDLLVIDEAHCISIWGHNFRPDYLRLPRIIKELGNPPILALTATATMEVEKDIQEQLGIDGKVFKASFDRPNLYFEVISLEDNIKKELFLLQLLSTVMKPAIIFVTYQRTAEKLAELISAAAISCLFYHAGLESEEREKRQNAFISGECDIIIATIAFGMGIDKPNIRSIIHYNLPQSIENYYQEIGRAGRDGNISTCITLFNRNDERNIKNLIANGWPNQAKIREILLYFNGKNKQALFLTARKLYFDCDVKEIAANLILHRLEEMNLIKIYSHVPFRMKLMLELPLPLIIEKNQDLKDDLQRLFSSSFFHNSQRKWFLFEEAMDEGGWLYFKLLELLRLLKSRGAVQFLEVERRDLVLIKDEIRTADIAPLVRLFQTILERDLQKVDALVEVFTQHSCLRRAILQYFAEPDVKENCPSCGFCLGKNTALGLTAEIDENYASDDQLKSFSGLEMKETDIPVLKILKSLLHDRRIPHDAAAKIFTGSLRRSNGKWKFQLRGYGILAQFKHKEEIIEKMINWCLDNQLAQEEVDGCLRITKKGIEYVVKIEGGKKWIN